MSSNAMSNCCVTGVQHEGEAKGTFITIGDVKTYIAEPASKDHSKAILFLTDAFGLDLINNFLMADDFAAQGYFVVMPDLFQGDPVPGKFLLENNVSSFDFRPWAGKHGVELVDPVVKGAITAMRETMGVQRIAAVGYCFGAKSVTRFLDAKSGSQVDVGYVAHPSLTTIEEFEAMNGPFAISAAETDHVFQPEYRHQVEELLRKKGEPYQITLYGGVVHGFAVRADLGDKTQVVAKENAFQQAVSFFRAYL